jgi:hypothetical protein
VTAAEAGTTLDGVDADVGLELLEGMVDEVMWLDRSAFMSASFGYPAPWLRHTRLAGLTPPPCAEPDTAVPLRGRRVAVSFAPEYGTKALDWARIHGYRLLAPDRATTAQAADKIAALDIFAAADVDVAEHVILTEDDAHRAEQLWPRGWKEAVLQRRENNLVGRGTVAVTNPGELELALRAWPGRSLKLSKMMPGLSVTVTGCVGGDRTVVSGISHQLVGIPEIAPSWGAHCGNQLLNPEDLPPGRYEQVRAAASRVGEVLRARGYRGVFGMDLLCDGPRVLAVEINPRFQTVTSLVQAAEHAAGLLPMLGLHVLACALPRLPEIRSSSQPVPVLSQIVAHAPRAMTLSAVPKPGCYTLDTQTGHLGGPAREVRHTGALTPNEALCWPHAAPGPVERGDELFLLQVAGRLCPLDPRPALGRRACTWAEAFTNLFTTDPFGVTP